MVELNKKFLVGGSNCWQYLYSVLKTTTQSTYARSLLEQHVALSFNRRLFKFNIVQSMIVGRNSGRGKAKTKINLLKIKPSLT